MKKDVKQLIERRRSILRELPKLGGLISGSFFERSVKGKPRFCLSRMCGNAQRQVYISKKHSNAVSNGVEQYKIALSLLHELGEINLKLLKMGMDLDGI